jgi:hypothetical protein
MRIPQRESQKILSSYSMVFAASQYHVPMLFISSILTISGEKEQFQREEDLESVLYGLPS